MQLVKRKIGELIKAAPAAIKSDVITHLGVGEKRLMISVVVTVNAVIIIVVVRQHQKQFRREAAKCWT